MNDAQYTVVITSHVFYNISCYLEATEGEKSDLDGESVIRIGKNDDIRKGSNYYEHLSTLGNEGNTIFLASDFSSLEAIVLLRGTTGKYDGQIDLNPFERWSSILKKLEWEGVKLHNLETYQEGAFSDIIRQYVPPLLTRLKLLDPMDLYIYGGALRYRAKEVIGPGPELALSISKLRTNPDPEWNTIAKEIIELTGLSGTEELPVAKIFD